MSVTSFTVTNPIARAFFVDESTQTLYREGPMERADGSFLIVFTAAGSETPSFSEGDKEAQGLKEIVKGDELTNMVSVVAPNGVTVLYGLDASGGWVTPGSDVVWSYDELVDFYGQVSSRL